MSLSVGHFRDGDGVIVVLTMMTLVPELTPMSGQTLSHLQGQRTSIKHLVLVGFIIFSSKKILDSGLIRKGVGTGVSAKFLMSPWLL